MISIIIYCDGRTDFVRPQLKTYQCFKLEKELLEGKWRKSNFIEPEGYFSIDSSLSKRFSEQLETLVSKFPEDIANNVIRRRANQLPTLAQQEPEISFWTNPATTNKITFWTASVTTVAVIVALIVGIPAYLTLNKSRN